MELPHQQDQQTVAAVQPSWTHPVEQLLESARNQQSGEIIRQVREEATREYKLTKQRKQQELSPRVNAAKGISKVAFKSAKKKADNHASSVASRFRRVFLIASYEDLVKNKMRESSKLAEMLLVQREVSTRKDVEIRRLQLEIHSITKERDTLKAQISKNQSTTVPPSCNSLAQDNTWAHELTIGSDPYDTTTPTAPTSRYIRHDAAEFSPLHGEVLQEQPYEDADEQDDALTSYLERVAAQTPAEGIEDCLKTESGDWGALPMINFRDTQAQIKADTPDDILHPAV